MTSVSQTAPAAPPRVPRPVSQRQDQEIPPELGPRPAGDALQRQTRSSQLPPAAVTFASPGQDRFTRDFLRQLLDPTLSPRDRLALQPRAAAPNPATYGLSFEDGTPVPPPAELAGASDPVALAARIDAWYGSAAPDGNTIAQNMGEAYRAGFYDKGRGGSTPADVRAYDLFDNGKGVCVEIHAAIAAYRQGKGQEAYVLASSAAGESHAFLIFKDAGKWYIQNYGVVIAPDARTLSELFDKAMPEEMRPRLYRVGEGGRLVPAAQGFLTTAGREQRRFSDEAGMGTYDPFRDGRDRLRVSSDGALVVKDGAVAYADVSGRAGFGYYWVAPDGLRMRGTAVETVSREQELRAKYEQEERWVGPDRSGRQRWSVFGGVELAVPRPVYKGVAGTLAVGKIGASYARDDARLYGRGPLRLEAGYDLNVRGVYTYGLDDATRDGYTTGLNRPGAVYPGDGSRIYADAALGGGPRAGLFWRPDERLFLRAGLRAGVELSDFDSTRDWVVGLAHTLVPSAYGEAQFRTRSVAAGVLGDLPLLGDRGYRVAGGLAVTPAPALSLGGSYAREGILADNDDMIRGAVEYRPARGLAVRGEAQIPGPGRAFQGDYRGLGFLQAEI